MARQTDRPSDLNYNARRRYLRNAERYLNKANETIGAEKERYKALARDFTSKAAELYERKADITRSKPFRTLSEKLGVNINEFIQSDKPTKREQQRIEELREKSLDFAIYGKGVTKGVRAQRMREAEAQAILSSEVGGRIYAGTVEVWTEEVDDKRRQNVDDINAALMKHFGVSSLMDLIETIERKTQISIFSNPESLERYDVVTLAIAKIS